MKFRIDFKRSGQWVTRWNEAQKARIIHKLGGKTDKEYNQKVSDMYKVIDNKKQDALDELVEEYEPLLKKIGTVYAQELYEPHNIVRFHFDVDKLHFGLAFGRPQEVESFARLLGRYVERDYRKVGLAGLTWRDRQKYGSF